MIMTTRQQQALTSSLEAWANWTRTGKPRASAKMLMISLTAKPYKGVMPLEEKIEAIVMRLAANNPTITDALRMATGAGWQGVFKRRNKRIGRFLWLEATDADKAAVLGVSECAYRLQVNQSREAIYLELCK